LPKSHVCVSVAYLSGTAEDEESPLLWTLRHGDEAVRQSGRALLPFCGQLDFLV